MKKTVELIYITHNRLYYTQKTLPIILSNAGYPFKLTIVDNNSTDGTKEYLKQYENHPSIKVIIYNENNEGLSKPTNNFWAAATSDYVGKVDNDTMPPNDWLKKLVSTYNNSFILKKGVLAGCAFLEEDFEEELAKKTILVGQDIIKQPFVGGCCYIIDKNVIKKEGYLEITKEKIFGWTQYQERLTQRGYINGYIYPFMYVDHMDDPRSPNFNNSPENILKIKKTMSERKITVEENNLSKVTEWIKKDGKNLLNPTKRRKK